MAYPSSDLPRSTLAILLTCRHLRVLKPSFVRALGIDDAFVTKFALARSSSVRIVGRYTQIDVMTVPEEEPEMQSLSLETLHIDHSRVADVQAVERYLRILAAEVISLTL